jgi:hypothetical protein
MARSSVFRLSHEALDRLATLAEENSISRAAVLELLIRRGNWLSPPTSERKSPEMTRPLDKPDLWTMRVRDVTADLIDAPGYGNVLALPRLLQDRYSSDEEVAV